jgi:TusA-related sulfurtransferase
VIRDLDITRDVCPATFAKVSQAVAELASDEVLRVVLRQDALKGVMTSLKANGHPVVRAEVRDGHVILEVRKAG